LPRVVAGLDPATHDEAPRATSVLFELLRGLMDARVKPAHDAECVEKATIFTGVAIDQPSSPRV
jgi:hypothetical protein